jgi:hypothetical protein
MDMANKHTQFLHHVIVCGLYLDYSANVVFTVTAGAKANKLMQQIPQHCATPDSRLLHNI